MSEMNQTPEVNTEAPVVETPIVEAPAPVAEPAPAAGEFDSADVNANRAMGIISYLSLLFLVPLFAAKNSPFARKHCNQGMVLAIVEVAAATILGILGMIPYIGWLFSIAAYGVNVVCVVFSILGLVAAAKGTFRELPIIGKIQILK